MALRALRESEGCEVTKLPMREPPILHSYQQHTMINQVRRYLTEHPGVEMTFTQLQRHFGMDKARSHDIVRTLTKEGLIESVHVVRAKGRAA